MISFKKIPHPVSLLFVVIVLAAAATWVIPAGVYDKLVYNGGGTFILQQQGKQTSLPFQKSTLDSLGILADFESFEKGGMGKPFSVPGTYRNLPQQGQGFLAVMKAPLKGFYETVEIILFLFLIGGFINVFYATGAMEQGLLALSRKMKGHEGWLIIILTYLFSFGGASFGMAEEGLAFYPILVPLFLAAGYDLLVPVGVIFGGTQLGLLSSFSNPFSTIIASNAAGVDWTEAITLRLLVLLLASGFYIWYLGRYARKVRKDPSASLVLRYDGAVASPFSAMPSENQESEGLSGRNSLLLLLFLGTFLLMIGGVVFLGWWLLDMTVIFLVAAVLVALLVQMSEKEFIEKFMAGAAGLLVVGFIIAAARGVGVILENGQISDSLVYYPAQLIGQMPPSLFLLGLMGFFMVIALFIPSSSGIAVVTMPIVGSLGAVAGVPGQEIVNSYLFGMGIAGFIIPTGLVLPSLIMVNVSLQTWWKFIRPLLLFLIFLSILFLMVGLFLAK